MLRPSPEPRQLSALTLSFALARRSAGFGAGVYDGSAVGDPKGWHGSLPFNLQGVVAWLAWRSAYWGKQVSLENKLLIPMYWFKAWAFGRSTARF